jgi:hypothetical protein
MTSKDRSVVAATGTVVIRGNHVSLDSDDGTDFIQNCARNVEGLLSESELKAKYQLSDDDWAGLAKNEQLLRAVRTEVDRRIANGECAREAALRHHARAPSILNEILQNETISPRHRIEAAKELRQLAGSPRENNAPGEKFIINIDLGEGRRLVKEFEQPARIPGNEGDAQ